MDFFFHSHRKPKNRRKIGRNFRFFFLGFIQIKKVLEAMEITSDTTKIRITVFQLESEAKYDGNGQGPLETLEEAL